MAKEKSNKQIKINVGCGGNIKEGYINIDTHNKNGANLLHKLPEELPFENESIDEIYASHILEDFNKEDYFKIMEDFHRILKKGGILHIKVPIWNNELSYANPHHQGIFCKYSFEYLYRKFNNYDEEPKYKLIYVKENRFNQNFMKWLKDTLKIKEETTMKINGKEKTGMGAMIQTILWLPITKYEIEVKLCKK